MSEKGKERLMGKLYAVSTDLVIDTKPDYEYINSKSNYNKEIIYRAKILGIGSDIIEKINVGDILSFKLRDRTKNFFNGDECYIIHRNDVKSHILV
jgi:hypothetical protein